MRVLNVNPVIFSPAFYSVEDMKDHKIAKTLKKWFDTSDGLLCICNNCVQLWFIENRYNEILRFNQNLATILGANIKNEKHKKELFLAYDMENTKEGLILQMVKGKGLLEIACPNCIHKWITDFSELLHESKKDNVLVDGDHMFFVTNKMIDKILILIDKIYQPLFRGYTTIEDIQKNKVALGDKNIAKL